MTAQETAYIDEMDLSQLFKTFNRTEARRDRLELKMRDEMREINEKLRYLTQKIEKACALKLQEPKSYTLDTLPAFKRSEARFNALTPAEQEARIADVLKQIEEGANDDED